MVAERQFRSCVLGYTKEPVSKTVYMRVDLMRTLNLCQVFNSPTPRADVKPLLETSSFYISVIEEGLKYS